MNKMKTTVIVEELMKELGYAAIKYSDPHCLSFHADVRLLGNFTHEDNDKIWVYIMDDSNTSIRLWREPNMYTEVGALFVHPAVVTWERRARKELGIGVASSKVIDLTDPNSFVKVKKFLNRT